MTSPGSADVRMRGFAGRTGLEDAVARLRPLLRVIAEEPVAFAAGLGRTLARDIVAEVAVPGFTRSAVDGYGIHAEESFGAQASNPLGFELAGESFPGRPFAGVVGRGQAVLVMTGAPLPPGVDAVAMAEHAVAKGGRVFLSEAVPPGKHVVAVGEDIRAGDVVLRRGRVLRPQDLGVLASIGCLEPSVRRRPRVAVAVTGNEVVPPGPPGSLAPFSVVNSNAPVIEALVGELGGEAIPLGIVRDDPEAMRGLVRDFPGDLLVTTGGTSVGLEDYLPLVVAELGEMVVHGIGIRPGYPSGFGRVGERLVFLLPGNPVAAMVGFDVLVRPAVQWMLGQEEGRRNPRLHGRLTRKVASALNRVDFVRVEVKGSVVTPLGSGGAGVLSSMTRADGFVIVPRDLEGLDPGTEVEVYLL